MKLEELANKFSGIFNSTFQFIGFLSPEGILLEANQTAMDFAGLYKEDLIGKPFWECYWWTINEETQNYLKENIKRAAKGEFIQYEVEVLGKDSTVTIHFNLKPLFDDQGKVIAIIPEGRPIQDIVEARKALEMKNQELERFAHIASHDLKEPLKMVHSFMGLMEKNYAAQLDEKARKYIHFALDATQRMTVLINDILEYAKIGGESTPFQKVDSNQLLDEIIPLFQAELEEKNGKIQFQNLPTINVQRTPLKLLFQNLINNGLKYQNHSNSPIITISAVEQPEFWRFCVADNGIGIPEKYFKEIFSMFKRLHSKEEFTGTGMGLSTCSKIVQQHGGEIWVESEEGKGSKFFFTIKK
ncbi:ATP-binding protein [Belliella pelovolcani]|uniref:PAS domain-containing sensor histidine kinase n=1 Tax=Belliella pelovolcani TaxID=529505 RepID=UPI00391C2363